MSTKLSKLLKDSADNNDVASIKEILEVCDNIYYLMKRSKYKGVWYTYKDLPTDEDYDYYRKTYTPEFKPSEYYKFKQPTIIDDDLVQHPYPMGSLEKLTGDEMIKAKDRFPRVRGKDSIVVSAKADGISLRCWYRDGKLEMALTRYRDPKYGRLATEKASLFVERPDPSFKGEVIVRGEVLMINDCHKKLGYVSARHGAAALMNAKENSNIKECLTFVVYELTDLLPSKPPVEDWPSKKPSKVVEQFQLLERLGFNVIAYETLSRERITVQYFTKLINGWKKSLPYDIDGAVVTSNLDVEGIVETPKMKVALKLESQGEWTVVKAIEPRVKRTGIVIPQIYVEPVFVDGVKITSIAGSNYDRLEERGIGIGSRVKVVRSGEIIPFIKEIDEATPSIPPNVPTVCPLDGTTLVKEGRILKCPNPKCPAKSMGEVLKYIKTIRVSGFGEKRLQMINVSSIEELYAMKVTDFEKFRGIGSSTANQLYQLLRQRLDGIAEDILLAAISPPLIGNATSTLVLNYFTLEELFGEKPVAVSELVKIPGLGKKKAMQLHQFHQRGSALIELLKSYGLKLSRKGLSKLPLDGTKRVSIENGKRVCLTGRGTMTRASYKKAILDKGWILVNAITKSTSLLVATNPNITTAKMEKARRWGIKIIDYKEFDKMLGLN